MPTNYYLPFAAGTGANVWSDATYNGSSQQQTGIQTGIVPSGLMSKAWRQSAAGSSVMGQIITAYGLVDAVDDGNIAGLAANYRMSIAAMLAGAYIGTDSSTTANTLIVALDPAPPALPRPVSITVKVAVTNTGAAALTLNTLGQHPVLRRDATALQAGDIVAGQYYRMIYDTALAAWRLDGLASISQITQQLEANVKTTTFSHTVINANVPNNAYAILTFSDASTADFINNGSSGVLVVTPGLYFIQYSSGFQTGVNQTGSNDVHINLSINGQTGLAFGETTYYANSTGNWLTQCQCNVITSLRAGDVVQPLGAVSASGYVSANNYSTTISFTKLF